MDNSNSTLATVGGGCFWCTEAIFQQLKGVESVLPGYTGGTVKNPSYKEVCTGTTGHAEAIQIKYDPGVISYRGRARPTLFVDQFSGYCRRESRGIGRRPE